MFKTIGSFEVVWMSMSGSLGGPDQLWHGTWSIYRLPRTDADKPLESGEVGPYNGTGEALANAETAGANRAAELQAAEDN